MARHFWTLTGCALAVALGASACSGSAQNGDSAGGSASASAGSGAAAGSSSVGASGGAGSSGNGGQAASGGGAVGSAGLGGAVASAGGSNTGGSAGSGGQASECAQAASNQHPFGCNFAWGIADPSGSLANYSYLQFASFWVDSAISAAGTYTACGGCKWLQNKVAASNVIPAYYAYIIGYLGHANGIVDGNQTGTKKLPTYGAALIKAHRAAIIDAYAWYAKQTAAAWPTKPLVWLLEGDFVQYAATSQTSPLSYAELGQLAADITCAIKSNMPNAVVAIDHSSWNTDDVTKSYWGAMQGANYDLVWTTGVGNNQGFIEGTANSTTYNHATATYAYLHTLTGRPLLVDTSAGASAAGDSWSTASLSDLNARIADGVLAANITGTAPTGLQTNIGKLAGVTALPACQ